MKVKRTIRSTSEMNLVSSSDIAFLLIIFFLVTSAFIFKDGIDIILPDKKKKPQIVENKDITTVIVEGEDFIKLNNKRISLLDLEKELKKLIEKNPETIVLLKIRKEVVYQKVIDIIDIIRITNVQKLSLRMIDR